MTWFPTKSSTLIRPVPPRFRTVQDTAVPMNGNCTGTEPLNVPLSMMAPDSFTTPHRPLILTPGRPETSMTKVEGAGSFAWAVGAGSGDRKSVV